MSADRKAVALLYSSTGAVCAQLHVSVLPRKANTTVRTLWGPSDLDAAVAAPGPIEVVEGGEYRYQWLGADPSIQQLLVDPAEIFQPDTEDGRSGRLRPGLATGNVQVKLRGGDAALGHLEIEIRSRKLSYQSEYQWMLRDIAEQMTELVMDRFAISEARFELDATRDAVTLYQRFTFLRALLESDAFQVAIREILRRPHTAWEESTELMRPGAGIRGSSDVIRQLSKGGSRTAWTGNGIASVPAKLERRRTEATHHTTPNEFVKFALEHWCQILGDIDRGLAGAPSAPATARGRREISALLAQLEEVLHHDLFKELKPLTRFPADDQVLQKREGYRDIFKAYVEFELASRLSWRREKDTYGAGLRDVATLYEYWAFIQLARAVATLVGQSFDMSPLVDIRSDGLNVVLQSGFETVLSGEVERYGRRMKVELCFNRTFGVGRGRIASWTRPMRPDYSLIVRPADGEPGGFQPVVLHFDAKYRVEFIENVFGAADDIVDEEVDIGSSMEGEKRGGALRSDLLKMHAYRDAIRQTAGAYILYPGGDAEVERRPFTQYQELLPGLGAFVLRPADSGAPCGALNIQRFLNDVLDHLAIRLTRHERGRYWLDEIYDLSSPLTQSVLVKGLPPDTHVLLGLADSREHWEWIKQHNTYNVSAGPSECSSDGMLMQSQFLLLFCPSSEELALARIVSSPELLSLESILATGYAPHGGGSCWCVQLSWIHRPDWLVGVSPTSIRRAAQSLGTFHWGACVLRWGSLQSKDEP